MTHSLLLYPQKKQQLSQKTSEQKAVLTHKLFKAAQSLQSLQNKQNRAEAK